MNKNSPFSKSLYQFYTRVHTNSYINFQLTKQFIIYRIDKFYQSISKKINQALRLSVIILILSNRYLLLQITKIYHTQKKKKKIIKNPTNTTLLDKQQLNTFVLETRQVECSKKFIRCPCNNKRRKPHEASLILVQSSEISGGARYRAGRHYVRMK